MVQDLSGGDIEIAEVLGLQAADEHFVDGSDKQLFECFVGGAVLFKKVSNFDEGGADVGGLGTVGSIWDDWCWARVRGWNEGDSREIGVDGRGDGEVEEAEDSIAEMGLD